jgi:hypothetical protein
VFFFRNLRSLFFHVLFFFNTALFFLFSSRGFVKFLKVDLLAQQDAYVACRDLFLDKVEFIQGTLGSYMTAECIYDVVRFLF